MKKNITITLIVLIILSLCGCTKNTIPKSALKTDTDALYQIASNINNKSENIQIFIQDDIAHIGFISPDLNTQSMKVINYSIKKDKVLSEIELKDDIHRYGSLSKGRFYDVLTNTGKVIIYNKSGKVDKEYTLPDAPLNYAIINDECTKIAFTKFSDGKLYLYDIKSDKTSLLSNDVSITYYEGKYQDNLYFRNIDSKIYSLNFKDSSLKKINMNKFRQLHIPYSTTEENNYLTFVELNNYDDSNIKMIQTKNEIYSSYSTDKYLSIVYDTSFELYNLKESTKTKEIDIKEQILSIDYLDDLLFITTRKDENTYNFYLYDINNSIQEPIKIDKINDSIIYKDFFSNNTNKEINELIDKINTKYRVHILYGETKEEVIDVGYKCETANEEDVLSKIKATEKFLELLPKDMIKELTNDRELWLYLCYDIASTDNNHVGGFATTINNHLFATVNIKGSDNYYIETLAHELAHLFDYHIDQTWLNNWYNLLPESIRDTAYSNSSYITNDYTPYRFDNSEVWFYDLYSKTNDKEDRAVIFQKIVASYYYDRLEENFKYENVKYKADYYCTMLYHNYLTNRNSKNIFCDKYFNNLKTDEQGNIK